MPENGGLFASISKYFIRQNCCSFHNLSSKMKFIKMIRHCGCSVFPVLSPAIFAILNAIYLMICLVSHLESSPKIHRLKNIPEQQCSFDAKGQSSMRQDSNGARNLAELEEIFRQKPSEIIPSNSETILLV